MDGLHLKTSEFKGAQVLSLSGSAGMTQVDRLTMEVTRLISGHPSCVVLDLAGLEFLCSLAVGQFVILERAVRSRQGKIAVVGANANIASVLHRCKLDNILPTAPTVEAAVNG